MITNVQTSIHVQEDRLERLTKIGLTIGFGNEFTSVSLEKESKRYVLTDTGVLMVYSLQDKKLITVFVPKLQYVKKYFAVLPFALELIIRNNQKKGYYNLQIERKEEPAAAGSFYAPILQRFKVLKLATANDPHFSDLKC